MKSAIFDMDGVVVDSVEAYAIAFYNQFRKIGLEVKKERIRQMVGMTPYAITEKIFEENDIKESVERFVANMSEEFKKIGKGKIKRLPKVIEFLEKLDSVNVKNAIASGTTPELIKFTIEIMGMRKYFQEIVSGSEVEKGKPEPDIFLLAAKKLNVDLKDCIVFEDSIVGVEAAKRAGMECIGLATGHYSIEELKEKNILAVNNFGELLPKLEEMFLEKI